ncbi:hypothetical protein [Prochlorococcus sp. MIT 1300]|nr:hypothetical protein [Prochlorococcus sp. MIT 1300]
MKTTSSNSALGSTHPPIDILLGRAAMLGFVFTFGVYLTVETLTTLPI